MNHEFRKWASGFGGSIEPSIDDSIIHIQMAQIIKLFEAEIEFIKQQFSQQEIVGVNVVAGFFQNEGISSRTKSVNGFDLIGVDVGLIAALNNIFAEVSKISTVLNTLDNNIGMDSLPLNKPDWSTFVGLGKLEGFHHNDIRNIADLTSIAIRYIMHHELAHIWNGHVSWSDKVGSYEDISQDEIHNISRAMEYDADNRASTAILMMHALFFFSNVGNPIFGGRKIRLFQTYSKMFEGTVTIETVIHRHVSTIYIAMRMQAERNGLFSQGVRHPSMSNRIIWFINNCFIIFGKETNISPMRVAQIIVEAIKCCETAISEVMKVSAYDPFSDENVNQAVASLDEAKRTWDKYRDRFEMHKRGVNLTRYHTDSVEYTAQSGKLDITEYVQSIGNRINDIPSFDVEAGYYSYRIMMNVRFCLPFVNIGSLQTDFRELDETITKISEACSSFDDKDSNACFINWVKFLRGVARFEAFINGHSVGLGEWITSRSNITFSDNLIGYIIFASSLDEESQKYLIEKRPLPIYGKMSEALSYTDIVSVDNEEWPVNVFCFKNYNPSPMIIAPSTNFTVIFNKNIGIVKVAMRTALMFFIECSVQIRMFDSNIKTDGAL